MKNFQRWFFAALLAGSLAGGLSACAVEVRPAMPADEVEVVPAPPYAGAVWIKGFWDWNPGFHRWVWTRGHWRGREEREEHREGEGHRW